MDQPNSEEMIKYLILHQVISPSVIRHYVVLQEFYRIQAEKSFSTKTKIVEHLAEKFHLHKSSIWLILKEHQNKFRPIKELPCST